MFLKYKPIFNSTTFSSCRVNLHLSWYIQVNLRKNWAFSANARAFRSVGHKIDNEHGRAQIMTHKKNKVSYKFYVFICVGLVWNLYKNILQCTTH